MQVGPSQADQDMLMNGFGLALIWYAMVGAEGVIRYWVKFSCWISICMQLEPE
jgi:hypothetical protein